MTSREVIDAIHARQHTAKKVGLGPTFRLMEALHIPPKPDAVIVHVAGTNGKGSTCAMLERVLREAGYRTGLYTSPFLQSYHERIRICGEPMDDDRLAVLGSRLLACARELEAHGESPFQPFELGTVLAGMAFLDAHCDIWILETGMGGRLDATSCFVPSLCAVTRIGMDHMQILGDTLEAIAGEKAGILRPGVPVVVHPSPEKARQVIFARAKALECPVYDVQAQDMHIQEEDSRGLTLTWHGRTYRIALPGTHQAENASGVLLAVKVLQTMGLQIPEEAVSHGLARVVWPGRLEWIGPVCLDSAHNTDGMRALLRYADRIPGGMILILGKMKDKQMMPALMTLARRARLVYCVCPEEGRGMEAGDLARSLRRGGCVALSCESPEEALEKAQAMRRETEWILVTGSMYLVGHMRTVLGQAWRGGNP